MFNGATVETVDDLIKYINADTTMDTSYSIDMSAAKDGFNKAVYTVTYRHFTGANSVAGVALQVVY